MTTDIVLTDLTNGSLDPATNEWTGTGVFDVLVEAVNKNIEGQFNLGRINGTDYANVYLGGLQSVIAQSMQYLLQEKQVEAQTDLLVTQKNEAELDGIAKRAEIDAQTQLIKDQDSELLANGEVKRNEEVLDGTAKRIEIGAQTDLLTTQRSELESNGVSARALKTKDGVVKDKQADLLVRQKQSLDDSLLKDLYKESVGGYSMVYEALNDKIAPPVRWGQLDLLYDRIQARTVDITKTPQTLYTTPDYGEEAHKENCLRDKVKNASTTCS